MYFEKENIKYKEEYKVLLNPS